MNTPRDNEKTTAEFRLAMLEKLNMNNHKKHWNEASLAWLNHRLSDEIQELEHELTDATSPYIAGTKTPQDAIIYALLECADVANMAMFIWDNLRNGIIDGSSDSEYLEPDK